jgi:hypothetical protein
MPAAMKAALPVETLADGGALEPEPGRDSGGDRSGDDGAEQQRVQDLPGVPSRCGPDADRVRNAGPIAPYVEAPDTSCTLTSFESTGTLSNQSAEPIGQPPRSLERTATGPDGRFAGS